MKRIALLLSLLVALSVAGTTGVSAATNTSPDQTLPWPGSEANHASYWDAYFGKPGACVKFDIGGDSITIGAGH